MKEINNYIKINHYISSSGQPTKKQFKKIAKKGFEVVINLATCDLTRGALKQEDKIVSECGMVYFHIPISWEKPEIGRMELFLETLKMLQKENKKIWIHCIKNYRVSVFLYRYKKDILKQKGVKLIAPKEYKPNKVWKRILKNRF